MEVLRRSDCSCSRWRPWCGEHKASASLKRGLHKKGARSKIYGTTGRPGESIKLTHCPATSSGSRSSSPSAPPGIPAGAFPGSENVRRMAVAWHCNAEAMSSPCRPSLCDQSRPACGIFPCWPGRLCVQPCQPASREGDLATKMRSQRRTTSAPSITGARSTEHTKRELERKKV